jgi:hypothetical protein
VYAIVNKRFLLFLTTAAGSLCFAAPSALGQTLLTTESSDPSLYAASLIASITSYSVNTTVWFEWGIDTNYGQLTPPSNLQGTNALSFSNLITGLSPYTTHHCQAVASNVFGTALGGDLSFTTVPKFVQVGTNTDWSALVLSGDGRELAATRGGIIYVSTNLGVTFIPTTGTGSVFAISSNGSTILAASGSNIYVSMDRGSTWTSNTTPAAFSRFATSANAQNVAASDGGYVYTSTNFGATWKQSIVPYSPTWGLASSADGTQLYGVAFRPFTGEVYGSKNSGNTWSSLGVFGNLTGASQIACSADGSIIAVAAEATIISTNGGASWSGFLQPSFDNYIASSADGHTLIATADYGQILVSPDTGTTFYGANAPYGEYEAVMSSADGNTLAVFTGARFPFAGAIFLSKPAPSQPCALCVTTNTSQGLPTFQLAGQPGYNYIIEASTNLLTWANIAVLVNTNGTVSFTDTASTNYTQRFYRAVAVY